MHYFVSTLFLMDAREKEEHSGGDWLTGNRWTGQTARRRRRQTRRPLLHLEVPAGEEDSGEEEGVQPRGTTGVQMQVLTAASEEGAMCWSETDRCELFVWVHALSGRPVLCTLNWLSYQHISAVVVRQPSLVDTKWRTPLNSHSTVTESQIDIWQIN